MLQFPNKIKGIAIPIVIMALMMGMGMILLYMTTVRSQNRLDTLYEYDLRAYYLSESGFQYATGKLSESKRYEERWYAPQKHVKIQKNFGHGGKPSQGIFQVYLSQIDEEQSFSHLFLISKGIYYTGKVFADGHKEKIVSIMKGNLGYSPKPPSQSDQTLFILNKGPLNQDQLLSFINRDEYKSLFKVDNGAIPPKIRTLLEFLKTNKLEDIDFMSELAMMEGIAQLDHLNQKILRLKRLSKLIDNPIPEPGEVPNFGSSFHNPVGEISGTSNFVNIFGKVVKERLDVNQSSIKLSQELDAIKIEKKAHIIANEIMDLVQYFPPATEVKFSNKNSQGATKLSTVGIEQFRQIISSKFNDILLWDDLIKSQTQFELPVDKAVNLADLAEASGLKTTVVNLGNRKKSSPNGSIPSDEKPDSGQKLKIPYLADVSSTDTGNNSDQNAGLGSIESILENGDPYDDTGRSDIIKKLYEPFFDTVDVDDLGFEDLETGFLKIFMDSLKQQLHQFALETDLIWGRKPTYEEYQDFLKRNSIPSKGTITKVSEKLEGLFASDDYSYHFGSNIITLDTKQSGFTVVERKPETMRTELLNKLETYYFTHGAGTDEQFLGMFKNSTWGDSLSTNHAGKRKGYYESKFKTNYFIRHKTTGQEMLLHEYLRKSIQ